MTRSKTSNQMIRDVLRADDEASFTELLTGTDLDPKLDFNNAQWSGVPFRRCDIRGFDFTGSRMINCDMTDALIAEARFDKVETDRIIPNARLDPTRTQLRLAKDWEEHVKSWVRAPIPLSDRHLRPGAIFQDAPFAPEMVVVPSGSFMRGTSPEEAEALVARYGNDYRLVVEREQPRREVTIAHRLAVGRFPVTFEEWDFCHDDGGTKHKPTTDWERERQPVHSVSWDDITKDYLPWLNKRLGLSGAHAYRLLTEAEWEYCCRAGTETAYSFGDTITKEQAQFSEGELGSAKQTVKVGSFASNAWGLHDMHGNVLEWCQDIFHADYSNAREDGSAREDKPKGGTVPRVHRGGSWSILPQYLRSADRFGFQPDSRDNYLGFRLARTLNP